MQERQRDIQRRRNQRHIGQLVEVMVEGKNDARQQWAGRTSQNKVLNFSAPDGANPAVGSYVSVMITGSFPNSLLGQMVI